jgi:hypothetical protein
MALEAPEHTNQLRINFVNTILRLGLDNRTIPLTQGSRNCICGTHDDVFHPRHR